MREGAPNILEVTVQAELAPRVTLDTVAKTLQERVDALPETLRVLRGAVISSEEAPQCQEEERAVAARVLRDSMQQLHEGLRDKIGERTVVSREEYYSLALMARYDALAKALAEVYGVAADIHNAISDEETRARVDKVTQNLFATVQNAGFDTEKET
jgi:hypothetical protein